MCTSFAMKTNDFYFGRTMDLDYELHTLLSSLLEIIPFAFAAAIPCNNTMP